MRKSLRFKVLTRFFYEIRHKFGFLEKTEIHYATTIYSVPELRTGRENNKINMYFFLPELQLKWRDKGRENMFI